MPKATKCICGLVLSKHPVYEIYSRLWDKTWSRLAEIVKSYFRIYSILQIQSVKYMMTILYHPCNSSLAHLSTSEEGILMTNQKPDV